MALSLNPDTREITVPQADLTLVTGTLYSLDTDAFRKDVNALLASEAYIWLDDAYRHNTEVTVAGTTYARTIEFINNFSVTFEFTGTQYSVRLEGSNNNIFDVENGILNPTSLVTVIPTNSAGLIRSTIGIGQADLDAIADAVHDEQLSGHQDAGSAGRALSDVDTRTTTIDSTTQATDANVTTLDGKVDGLTNTTNTIDSTTQATQTQLGTVEGKVDALPTAADNADAVWDEATTDHQATGTFGAFVQNKLLTVAKFIGLK